MMRRLALISLLIIFFLIGCVPSETMLIMPESVVVDEIRTPVPQDAIPTINPTIDERLHNAQRQYNIYCAHCHGWAGEGQPYESAQRTESLGYHVVPRHNEEGHTWQHPDQILFETIKYGVQVPTNLYQMTAFEGRLTDDEIFAIVDYMKQWWTDEQREWQTQLTLQFEVNNPFWTTERDELLGNGS